MEITIRKETEKDFEQVFKIHKLAFKQENEATLVDLLRKSDSFVPELSLVAESENKIIGHILFTKNKIVNENQKECESLTLAPVSVLPKFQNLGIGSKLIMKGLEIAKELNFKSVIVLGHEKYYPKFGFIPAEKFNIKAPFEVPSQNFMAMELVENSLENVSGTVHYPKEFLMV